MNNASGKAVISGGTGFLGRHLAARLLSEGRDVVILTRRAVIPDALDGAKYVQLDFGCREDVAAARPEYEDVRTFFHLASDVDWSTEFSPAGLRAMQAQVEHPLLLLDALGPSLKRVVYASSMMVYPMVGEQPFVEGRDERPPNFYGAHKLVFEKAGLLWARAVGRTFTSARIGQVYGVGMRVNRFLLAAIETAVRGEAISVFGDGSPRIDWLHSGDVVAALVRCEEAGAGGCFNVGSGVGTSNLELARTVARAVGSASRVELRPDLAVSPRRQVLDIAKTRHVLDWIPRVELESEIAGMIGACDA